jgi:nucleoside-diphosphate-sugar epimerase
MDWRGHPVLVTGGAGFTGSYVARELIDQGRDVIALTHSQPSAEMTFLLRDHQDGFRTELGGVDDLPRLIEVVKSTKPAEIVHLASSVDVQRQYRNPFFAVSANLTGTLNVLEAARLFDVRRLIYFSSIGVLPTIQYEPVDAMHPLILRDQGPGSGGYGAAKASGELFAFAYNQAFGLDVRTIRPSAIYGFGMPWMSANYMKQFVEPAVRGEDVILSTGGLLRRDYTHVADVATLTAALVGSSGEADRVFYAATGRPLVSASQAARVVAELIPEVSIEIGGELTAEDEVEASFRGVISIDSARDQLGWEPRYGSLHDGVGEYISSYRAYLKSID